MKTITKFSVLVATMVASISMSYAALTKIDFETVEGGNAYFWAVFQNGPAASDVYDNMTVPFANPSTTGINTSAKCAKFIADPTAAPWAGCFTDDLGTFTLTDQNCKVKVMVNKNVISNFLVKFEGDAGNTEILVPNTVINTWEELTFDFSSKIGNTYKRLVIIPEFPSARTAGSTSYFDNISFNSGTVVVPPSDPTVAAPTPTVAAADVISIFSNAYTNATGVELNPNWGQNTVQSVITIAGNSTSKYTNFNYQGIDFSNNHINASSMSYLHVDIYPTTETIVRITPISVGPNELPTSLGALVANQWNSFNVPLTTYTGVNMADLFQFKLDGGTGGTFYMDNLYLSKVASGIKNNIATSTKCFPSQVVNKLIVTSENEISSVVISSLLGQSVKIVTVNGMEKSMDVSNLSAGNYIVTVNLQSGAVSTHKIVKL